jgi:DNA/RNA endonuclease YhcR with UshA esterase domain
MDKKESIYTQHEENTNWMKTLDFYKDEIKILRNRLEEITTKNNSVEVLSKVEHFQNQFIIQRDNIDNIAHAVKLNEEELLNEINRNPVAVDHRKMTYHEKEQDLVETFEKNFNEIRGEFNRFTSKWM